MLKDLTLPAVLAAWKRLGGTEEAASSLLKSDRPRMTRSAQVVLRHLSYGISRETIADCVALCKVSIPRPAGESGRARERLVLRLPSVRQDGDPDALGWPVWSSPRYTPTRCAMAVAQTGMTPGILDEDATSLLWPPGQRKAFVRGRAALALLRQQILAAY